MPKDLEQLGLELYLKGGFGHKDKFSCSSRHYRDGWIDIAKHVNQMLIDRAIRELQEYGSIENSSVRIAELQSQKQSLNQEGI